MSLELVVSEIKKQEIQITNYDTLKKEISKKLEKYKGLVLTEDNKAQMKELKSGLNKLVKAIDTERIAKTKEYNEPLNKFIEQCKELKTMVENESGKLDKQLKESDEKIKQTKKLELIKFFEDNVNTLKDLLKFENVFDERMLNVTYSQKVAEEEIKDFINKVDCDLKIIESLNTELENQLKDYYLKQFDMSKTLQEKARLEQQKKALEEVKVQKSEIIQEEPKKTFNQPVQTQINITETTEVLHRAFEVWGNREQIIALGNFMNGNNIKFKKIEGGI